jgi:hypothetical protein
MIVHCVSHEGKTPAGAGGGGFSWFRTPAGADAEFQAVKEGLKDATVCRFDLDIDVPGTDDPDVITEVVEVWLMGCDFTPPKDKCLQTADV